MQFTPAPEDVIWSDDRFTSSFEQREGVRIVGLIEVLQAAVAAGKLGTQEYYDTLGRLRAANARFIPLDKGEVLYNLSQAEVKNEEIVETTALGVLRRYIAACLLDSEALQMPPIPPESHNPHGELPFVMNVFRVAADALIEIASGADNQAAKEARSEWILSNLYLNHDALATVTARSGVSPEHQYLSAVSLAGLIAQAISLNTVPRSNGLSVRQQYLKWLTDRLLVRRFDVDRQLKAVVADTLKNHVFTADRKPPDEEDAEGLLLVLQRFFDDLPDSIQDELRKDQSFMESIALRSVAAIAVGDLSFDHNDFLRAAGDALNGREAAAMQLASDSRVLFRGVRGKHGKYSIAFAHPVTGAEGAISGEGLEPLLDSPIEREAALRRDRAWCDCSNEDFEHAVAEVLTATEAPRRVALLKVWRDTSASLYYRHLERRLRRQEPYRVSDLLPPSTEGLLRHLRLKSGTGNGGAFKVDLDASAKALLDEVGICEAFTRLAGLPVSLPECLTSAVRFLSAEDKRRVMRQLLLECKSPIATIHILRLLLVMGESSGVYRRLARRIAKRLLGERGEAELNAFLLLLKWVYYELAHKWQTEDMSPSARLALAWSHSHRLFGALVAANWTADALTDAFGMSLRLLPSEVFETRPELQCDISHPSQTDHLALLLCGLSYASGSSSGQFLDEEIRGLCAEKAFPIAKEGVPLAVPLLRDTSRASNALGSFLGGDRGITWLPVLGTEGQAVYGSAALRATAEEQVKHLYDHPDDLRPWSILHAILGDLPPCPDMVEAMKALTLNMEWTDLFRRNKDAVTLAIATLALQVKGLGGNDCRAHLRKQVIGIATLLGEEERERSGERKVADGDDDDIERHALLLLTAALDICSGVSIAAAEVVAEFSEIVEELMDAWPSMIPKCRPVFQTFCEELPVAHAVPLWRLLIRTRAE
jgi:hypothetical protein